VLCHTTCTMALLVCLQVFSLEGIGRRFCALYLQCSQLAVVMAVQRMWLLCCMCIMWASYHAKVSLQ